MNLVVAKDKKSDNNAGMLPMRHTYLLQKGNK